MLKTVIEALAPVVLPLLVSGLAALGALLGRWIHAHTTSNKLLTGLASGVDYVGAVVSHVVSGLEPSFQAALADGVITKAELDAIKAQALDLVKAEMPDALKTVANSLGPAFETWLSGKLSQAISARVGVPTVPN